MGFLNQGFEIVQGAVHGIDSAVVGNVVSVVHQWRSADGIDPQYIHSQFGKVIQALSDAV